MSQVTQNALEKTISTIFQSPRASTKIAAVLDALEELEIACQRKIDATDSFNDACKAVAIKAGIEPNVLSSYITARVKDTLEKQQKKSDQMALLFEEIK